jgi:PTS system mannose-specific IIB component/fructoselysine and glucoselysine-specific PTS system IIB component
MTLVLCRVDDRLVHGQVVVGWGQGLRLQRIVLADDDVAAASWEQDLYRMVMPAGMELVFAPVTVAAGRLREWAGDGVRTAILVGSIEAAAHLYRREPGLVRNLNLGGIHHRPGRTERLPYVYLSAEELALLTQLAKEGAVITGQDLPTTVAVPLERLG